MIKENCKNILLEFLNVPLDCGDQIFDRFSALPNAVVGKGRESLQRYVYIPGSRKDRIVLVAHMDTVWDKSYNNSFSGERSVVFKDGLFLSSNPECGIGADDRAGCAMCWMLKDSGHSILIVDGEEHGKHGARYLRKSNRRLFRELNKHRYMIELDWRATDTCLFNQVDNTKKFKKHITEEIALVDSKAKGGTDLQVLCRNVCGVNIGVGYYGAHTKNERLVLSEWENTYKKLETFLQKPQKRFHTKLLSPYLNFMKRCINKGICILKSGFPSIG